MTTDDLPIIYTDVRQRPTAIQLFESADVLEEAGGKLASIATEAQAQTAAEYRAQANKLIKELDAERLETTEGARKTIERINARFNAPIDKLRGLVRAIDKALQSFMAEKARKQREEREALERAAREEHERRVAEAAALEVEPPPPPPPVVVPPAANPLKVTGSHGATLVMRDNWKWRVVNIKKVPETLLVPPEERIQKAAMNSLAKAKAKEALAQLAEGAEKPLVIRDAIPGIELYNEPVNASSVL